MVGQPFVLMEQLLFQQDLTVFFLKDDVGVILGDPDFRMVPFRKRLDD